MKKLRTSNHSKEMYQSAIITNKAGYTYPRDASSEPPQNFHFKAGTDKVIDKSISSSTCYSFVHARLGIRTTYIIASDHKHIITPSVLKYKHLLTSAIYV